MGISFPLVTALLLIDDAAGLVPQSRPLGVEFLRLVEVPVGGVELAVVGGLAGGAHVVLRLRGGGVAFDVGHVGAGALPGGQLVGAGAVLFVLGLG
jgi:hypothetical protein